MRPNLVLPRPAATLLSLLLAGSVVVTADAEVRSEATGQVVLDAATRAEILDSLYRQVGAHYVEADTARMIGAAVRARAKAGAYDKLTDPYAFGDAVTRDLRKVNGDLHLALRYDPRGATPFAQPVVVRRVEGGPGAPQGAPVEGGRRVVVKDGENAPPPAGAGERRVVRFGDGPGSLGDSAARGMSPYVRDARERNFGLTKMEILPGNIGYLEVSGFLGTDGYESVIGDAMRFLARTDAVIIDVRRNGGGNGAMSHLLFSHFLPATPVPTIRVKTREEPEPIEQQSVADVPGPRRPDVPLYVLTSRGTASAAEEFSFVLENRHRATLVGDRTAGAGHMVAGFPVTHGFVASVSITRVSDPQTGAEWEGVGVQPDRKVAPEQALAVAHALALRELAAKAADPQKRMVLERTAQCIEAKANPVALDAARLGAIAGTYEGDRRVEVVDGRPMIRLRPGSMGEELVPMPDGSFAIQMAGRMRFAAGSPSPSVTIERADGSTSTWARVNASANATQ